jgi:circadian clock protein KaiC
VLKSRGMSHSNQIREFLLSSEGVRLVDVYLGPSGVMTGTARLNQEARERAEITARHEEAEGLQRLLDRKRTSLEAQIAALRAELEAEEEEVRRRVHQENQRDRAQEADREAVAALRGSNAARNRSGSHG